MESRQGEQAVNWAWGVKRGHKPSFLQSCSTPHTLQRHRATGKPWLDILTATTSWEHEEKGEKPRNPLFLRHWVVADPAVPSVPAPVSCSPLPSLQGWAAAELEGQHPRLGAWAAPPAGSSPATCFQHIHGFPTAYSWLCPRSLMPAFSLNHTKPIFSASVFKNTHRALFAAIVLLKTIFAPNSHIFSSSIYRRKHLKNGSMVRKIIAYCSINIFTVL